MASTIAPSAPIAAASLGVARPNRIAPSTDRISTASGNERLQQQQRPPCSQGMSVSSLGSFGASLGLIVARDDHVADVQAGQQEARA